MCDRCAITAERVRHILATHRADLSSEKRTQSNIATVLGREGIGHQRECRLGDSDIVDFLIQGHIALEVKLRYPRIDIRRQLARYAGHERVHILLLASNTAIALPPSINGKPLHLISLGSAWL